jgi:hypothetical protein
VKLMGQVEELDSSPGTQEEVGRPHRCHGCPDDDMMHHEPYSSPSFLPHAFPPSLPVHGRFRPADEDERECAGKEAAGVRQDGNGCGKRLDQDAGNAGAGDLRQGAARFELAVAVDELVRLDEGG